MITHDLSVETSAQSDDLKSGVCACRGSKKEQNSIVLVPDGTKRDHKGSSLDAGRTNHDEQHELPPVSAVKHFIGKRIAVDLLNSTVLGVPQHQTIEKNKLTLAFGRVLWCLLLGHR